MEGCVTILISKVDLDVCVAEELTYYIGAALETGKMQGSPIALISSVNLDIGAVEELT
jgi:hypothetical protein